MFWCRLKFNSLQSRCFLTKTRSTFNYRGCHLEKHLKILGGWGGGWGLGRGGERRCIFPPLPLPLPLSYFKPSTSPLKSVFDLSQLSGSINVQGGRTTSFLKTIYSWITLQNTSALQARNSTVFIFRCYKCKLELNWLLC